MSGFSNTGPGPPFISEDEHLLENIEQTLSIQQKNMSELKEKLLQFEADKKEKEASVKLKAEECYQKLMNLKSGVNKSISKTVENNEAVKKSEDSSITNMNKIRENKEEKINEKPATNILPPSQKMLLLKKQTEENKKKMAERINNQKGIALKVNKLLEQFDAMQPVFNPVVGMSSDLADCTDVDLLKNKIITLERTVSQLNIQIEELQQKDSVKDLLKTNILFSDLQNELNLDDKCMLQHMHNLLIEKDNEKQELRNQIFDLQENLKEKDLVIDSKTKALTLMSENFSRKGKNTVDLLEETKLEMMHMQQNFVQSEANLKDEIHKLKEDVDIKNQEINDLTKQNKVIEEKCEILQQKLNSNDMSSDYKVEIDKLNNDIKVKAEKISELLKQNEEFDEKYKILQEELVSYKQELSKNDIESKDIEALELESSTIIPSEYNEKTILQLQNENKRLIQSNIEQEKKINELNADIQLILIQGSQQNSKSPRKGNRKNKIKPQSNTDTDQLLDLQNQIKKLELELSEHQTYIVIKDDENNKLRDEIKEIKEDAENKYHQILLLQEDIRKMQTSTENPKSENDVIKLQQLLDDTTANSKKQIKYLQKQVDSFGKISDTHQAVVNLNQKVFELSNRVAELEEEKGNLQLHLVDYDANQVPDVEVNSKLAELKLLCQSQMHSIALLETQKFDLVQDLHIARQQISSLEDELADLTQTEDNVVSSEINNIQLEEKLEALTKHNDELTQNCSDLSKEKVELEMTITEMNKIHEDLSKKLNACLCENEDLVKKIDRIEQLNAEKVSSAESIEIVDNLTHKEKLEIENYEKGFSLSEDNYQISENPENYIDVKEKSIIEDETSLNISVAKLTEESSDLMEKIALFTQERKEMMERLDMLTFENKRLLVQITELEDTLNCRLEESEKLSEENDLLKAKNIEIQLEKNDLLEKFKQLTAERCALQDDMNNLLKEIENLKSGKSLDDEQCDLKVLYDSLLNENKNSVQVINTLNEKIAELNKKNNEVEQTSVILQEEYNLHKQMTFKRDCEIKDIIYELEKNKEQNKITIEDLTKSNLELLDELNKIRSSADVNLYKSQVDNLNKEIQRLSDLVVSSEKADKLYEELKDLKIKFEKTDQERLIYENELLAKNDTVNVLNEQIMKLYSQMETLSNENKDMESKISDLMNEAAKNNETINALLTDTKLKETEIEKVCEDLQIKQEELQLVQNNLSQLQSLHSSDNNRCTELQNINEKLEAKNKENIEKMKKLAANLKKKSSLCNEYEAKLNDAENKYLKIKEQQNLDKLEEYTHIINEKDKKITEQNMEIEELLKENKAFKETQFDRVEILNKIDYLEQSVHEKEIQNSELLDRINDHKFNYETSLEAIKAKLNEKEVYIESLESENNGNKEKISKLIDGLASIEERRRLLEERAEVLDAELFEKSAVCSEFANNEDLFMKRMKALVDQDEVLEKRLQILSDQNELLNANILDLNKQNCDLVSQINKQNIEIQEYQNIEKLLREAENENVILLSQNKQFEIDLKRTNDDLREMETKQRKQMDEMENDFSLQLQILDSERKKLLEKLEKLSDTNDNLLDEIVKLKDNIHQLEQIKSDLERDNSWLKLQNDSELSAKAEVKNLSKNNDEKQYERQEPCENLFKSEIMFASDDSSIYIPSSYSHKVSDELIQKAFHEPNENHQSHNVQMEMATTIGSTNEVPFFQTLYDEVDMNAALTEKDNLIMSLKEKIRDLEYAVGNIAYDNISSKPVISNDVPLIQSFNKNLLRNEISNKDINEKTENLENKILDGTNNIPNLQGLTYLKENEMQILKTSNQDQVIQCTLLVSDNDLRNNYEEKVKNLEIILSVKAEHIDELQKLIIEKDNEVTALQNGALSLASKMEEIIAAYQYLQNEFEKKQKEVNELIQSKNNISMCNEQIESPEQMNLKIRISELEDLLRTAKSEKEEALFKLKQLVYDMDSLRKQNIQLDMENQTCDIDPNNVCEEQSDAKDIEDIIVPIKTSEQYEEKEVSGWEVEEEDFFLEQSYQNNFYKQNLSSEANHKINSLQMQINNLEAEKSKISEELKQQQTKFTKLMMKLKEYKNKYIELQEQLKSSKKSSDCLDSAIEEIFTLRIAELENKLKTNHMEAEKILTEKNNLNKRIDILVVSNEKLVETKKNQDLEIERLNMLIRQLQLQSTKLESERTLSKPSECMKEVQENFADDGKEFDELQKALQELSIDNEELQAMLDDQKSSFEKRENKLLSENLGLTSKVDDLTKKVQELREYNIDQSETFNKNVKFYQDQILSIIKDNDLFLIDAEQKRSSDTLNNLFINYMSMLGESIKCLKTENKSFDKTIFERMQEIDDLNLKYSAKCQQVDELKLQVEELNKLLSELQRYKVDNDNLKKQLSESLNEIEKLHFEYKTQRASNQNNEISMNDLQSIIATSQNTIAELNQQLLKKSESITDIQAEVQNLQKYINELQQTIDYDKNSINCLNEQLFEKTKQLESLQSINEELVAYKNMSNDLQRENKEYLNVINELRQSSLIGGLSRGDNNPMQLNSNEVMNLQQENLNLKQIIEQNKNVIDDLNTRLFDATSQIEFLHKSSSERKNKHTSLKVELQPTLNNDADLLKLKNDYEILNVQYLEKCDLLNNIQQQEKKCMENINELNTIIHNNQINTANLQASLSEKSLFLEQLENENSILSKECGNLQENVNELNIALEQCRNLNESLNLQLAAKSLQLKQLEDNKSDDVEKLRYQKEDFENQLRACDAQWSQTIDHKCREIADSWKVHLVEKESQFSDKEFLLSSQIVALQQQLQDSNAVIENLNSLPKLKDVATATDVIPNQEFLTKEDENLKIRLEKSESDNAIKADKILQLEQELIKNQKEDYANNEISKLNDMVSNHQTEYKILENKFEELSHMYNELKTQSEENILLKTTEIENLSKNLLDKNNLLDTLSKTIENLTATQEEERIQMSSMRTALESQELELVTLKEQLGVEKLAKENTLQKQNLESQTQPSTSIASHEKPANKSELDLAMYMLHQRDMRCEELTMEVLSLLQERDTLQLRLSNALRLNETIRDDNTLIDASSNQNKLISDDIDSKSLQEIDNTKTEATEKKIGEYEMLKNKLSELHALDNSRDLRICDERKFRQQQQMALVEKDFEKLPKEAKQQLIDADYTLTQDYQGPSISLLNWLWGKGTKKVEHL